MKKKFLKFLEETELLQEVSIENVKELVHGNAKDDEKRKALVSVIQRAKRDEKYPEMRKKLKDIAEFLGNTKFSDLIDLIKRPISKITEGETVMGKKTNLDMFLEGIEEVHVSKKPKFHSIYRLYEAKDKDFEGENKEREEEGEEELDEIIVNETDDEDEDDGDDSEEDGKGDEESSDEDDEEDEEDDDSDEDEEEIKDEPRELDEAAFSRQHYQAIADILKKSAKGRTGETEIIQEIGEKLADLFVQDNPRFDAPKFYAAAGLEDSSAETHYKDLGEDDEELDEAAQGYASGLKGVRKDAGAKKLRSGTNKVPSPKVQITGDKKLLKKPTVAKGDSYPKSSVAGASRPGAPKVKKS